MENAEKSTSDPGSEYDADMAKTGTVRKADVKRIRACETTHTRKCQ